MRLIDADEIRKSIRESIDECVKWADEVKESEMYARVSQSIGTFVECSLRIKNAPTVDVLDKIRADIAEYKDDKIIHAEQNEMIDIMLEIIDKYTAENEDKE